MFHTVHCSAVVLEAAALEINPHLCDKCGVELFYLQQGLYYNLRSLSWLPGIVTKSYSIEYKNVYNEFLSYLTSVYTNSIHL